MESQCASDSECATAAAVLMQPQPQFVTFVVEPVICIFIPNVHFARRSVFVLNHTKNSEVLTLATNWSKCHSETIQNYYLQQIRKHSSEGMKLATNLIKREYWLSSRDICKNSGIESRYGESTNNACEQSNSKDRYIRDLPIVTSAMENLIQLSKSFSDRLQSARKMKADGKEVTDYAYENAKMCSKKLGNNWKVTMMNHDPLAQTMQCLVAFKKESTINFVVTLNANDSDNVQWGDRIKCACGYTVAFGYPCWHAAYVLFRHIPFEHNDKLYPITIWGAYLKKWYASVFEVDVYIMQYSKQVNIPSDPSHGTELIKVNLVIIRQSATSDFITRLVPGEIRKIVIQLVPGEIRYPREIRKIVTRTRGNPQNRFFFLRIPHQTKCHVGF